MDYGLYVGLLVNLPRVRLQQAFAVMQGLKASAAKELPAQIFDAIAGSEEQAEGMAFDANMKLAEQQARAAAKSFL